MPTSERLLRVLSGLKSILSYRLDDPIRDPDSGLAEVDEETFFSELYVPAPDLERECLEALERYTKPVLLLGKQGIGKTSVLEKVLRTLSDKQPLTIVRIRCTLNHRRAFESADQMEELLTTQLHYISRRLGSGVYEWLIGMFETDPEYIDRSSSISTKALYTDLSRLFEDEGGESQTGMDFVTWVKLALMSREAAVRDAVRRFESKMPLSVLVDLIAMQNGSYHRVLFVVDNVESLLDLDQISRAVSMLVRAPQLIGERGRLVVASRPRSYRMTVANQMIPRLDAGHNLFETVDFSTFLSPIIVGEDDLDDDSGVGIPSDLSVVMVSSRYWDLLERRLKYLTSWLPDGGDAEEEDVHTIFQGIRELFVRAPGCTHVIAGLANHSCRSFLIVVVNFIEHLLRDRKKLDSFLRLSGHYGVEELSESSVEHLIDSDLNASLLSDFLYFTGHVNATIPGLARELNGRLRIGKILELYRQTRQTPHDYLTGFFVLKSLDGCQVARFPHQEKSHDSDPIMSVGEIVERLRPLGFSEKAVLETVSSYCIPDAWDQLVLDFARESHLGPEGEAGLGDLVQLESRGWILANVLPFRFHYWRGDLAAAKFRIEGVWDGELSRAQVVATVRAIADWAELEINLVASAAKRPDAPSNILAAYRKVTHLPYTWCFVQVVRSLRGHLRRLAQNATPADTEGTALQEYLRRIALGETSYLERLEDTLTGVAERAIKNDLPDRWRLLSLPEFAWWNDFVKETGR